jgi:signal peptidase I
MNTITALVFSILLLPLYLFAARPFQITGSSMNPAYPNGAYVMTKIVNKQTEFHRGDVVVYKSIDHDSTTRIGRLFGISGDRILLNDNQLSLNGKVKLNEISPDTFLQEGKEIVIPRNTFFILGDNPSKSLDSRSWGVLPKENIVSLVWFCYANCN